MALSATFFRIWQSPNMRKNFLGVVRTHAVVTGFGLAAWGIGEFKSEFPTQAGKIQNKIKKKAKHTFSRLHSKALSIRATERMRAWPKDVGFPFPLPSPSFLFGSSSSCGNGC